MDNILNQEQVFVKQDGTTPFKAPQAGVDPVSDFHLTTKKFVTQLIQDVLKKADPKETEALITDAIANYVKIAKLVTENDTYSKKKLDELFAQYVRRDGTKSFTRNQQGLHPNSDYDITTKKYVDDLVYGYIKEADLDNFKLYVNNALNAKVKGTDVYKKTETYSKIQLEFLLQSLVADAAKESIADHLRDSYHLSLEDITTYLDQYLKKTEKDRDYVTLSALNRILESYQQTVADGDVYNPHGFITGNPVGWIDNQTVLPSSISYQDLFDLIFYDSNIELSINVPFIEKGVTTPVCATITATGLTDIEHVVLYKGVTIVGDYPFSDFDDQGILQVCNIDISTTTEFKVIIYYTEGATKEETVTVPAVAPFYYGLLPEFLVPSLLTYDDLQELVNDGIIDIENFDDPIYGDSTNNKKVIAPIEAADYTIHNVFEFNGERRRPFVIYPEPTLANPAKL
jgi:hypothetical protein